MGFKPMGNRVLIDGIKNQTISGIYIPDDVKRSTNRRQKGTVVGVPKILEQDLKVGDTVIFDDYGEQVTVDNKEYTLVDMEYIHAVLEE